MNNFEAKILSNYELPNKIDNSYLDKIIKSELPDVERIWSFCFRNAEDIDMTNISIRKLLKCSFSKDTVFPECISSKMSINKIFKLASKIDFGFEELNIQSEKIKIAVVDQPFEKRSKKFAKNIHYNCSHINIDSMHSNAILSIISRILPNADIFFWDSVNTFSGRYKALVDIYDYNKNRTLDERILVVSMSVKLDFISDYKLSLEESKKLEEIKTKLIAQGCYIVDSQEFYNANLYISSPVFNNDFSKIIDYEPGQDWNCNNINYNKNSHLLVPGGGKLYAYPSDKDDFYYCGTAAYSWSIPIIASFFAIAKQKNNTLSFKDFISKAFETCIINSNGYRLINICNLIEAL